MRFFKPFFIRLLKQSKWCLVKNSCQTEGPILIGKPWRLLFFGPLFFGLIVLQSSMLLASDEIRILDVTDYQKQAQLVFDSQSQFYLPEALIEAVRNEISLTFQTEILLFEHKTFAGLKYSRQRMQVKYHTQLHYSAFSNQFTLINERNNKVQSFKSLDEALKTLGTLSAFPILPLKDLHPAQKYTLKLNIHLNRWRLPAPLVVSSLMDPDWQLDSGWFERKIYTPKSWL